MTPDLTPHRFPCIRCGKMRRLSISDQLCWVPKPTSPHGNDTSCWRAAQRALRHDRVQDTVGREGVA